MLDTLTQWTAVSFPEVVAVLLSAVATYMAILVYTRVIGLRSFSKMSAADFAMTVAVGSLFASTISSPDPSLAVGLIALGALFIGQWKVAYFRRLSDRVSALVDNEPLLLMAGSEILDENLEKANVTRADLYAKLREANAFDVSDVLAVVFETTGDVSVLHSKTEDAELDLRLFDGVVGRSRLAGAES